MDDDEVLLKLDGIRDTLQILVSMLEDLSSRIGRLETAVTGVEAAVDD